MIPFLLMIARTLLVFMFVASGISKIMNFHSVVQTMGERGIPYAQYLLLGAVVLELMGALFVILGYKTRFGVFLLVLFLAPVTYLMHFKGAFDAQFHVIDQNELIQLLKNISIFGGLLYILVCGAGKFSISKK